MKYGKVIDTKNMTPFEILFEARRRYYIKINRGLLGGTNGIHNPKKQNNTHVSLKFPNPLISLVGYIYY